MLARWREQAEWLGKVDRCVLVEVVGPSNGHGRDAEAILARLPDWFADPAAVDIYVAAADRGPCWVVKEGHAAVGFLALGRAFPASAEIISMGVVPEYRGQGVGRSLVAAVTSWAIDSMKGCRTSG